MCAIFRTLSYLNPAIKAGFVRLLYPDSPRHPRQKYLLTVKGLAAFQELQHWKTPRPRRADRGSFTLCYLRPLRFITVDLPAYFCFFTQLPIDKFTYFKSIALFCAGLITSPPAVRIPEISQCTGYIMESFLMLVVLSFCNDTKKSSRYRFLGNSTRSWMWLSATRHQWTFTFR